MKETIKNFLAVAIVILLLPYVITLFISGKEAVPNSIPPDSKTQTAEKELGESGQETALEETVIAATARQISMDCQDETIKAQTVIARTGIKRSLEADPDSLKEQQTGELEKLWGYDHFSENYDRLKKLVLETEGQVLTWQNQAIEASFHAVSAGKTRSASEALGSEEFPYLSSVECPHALQSEEFMEIRTYTQEELTTLLADQGLKITIMETSPLENMQILGTDTAGYVNQIKIGDTTISGEEFRKDLSLNSSCFTLGDMDGKIRITTKGLGHGLGFDQYEADQMAKEGSDYQELLHYFYKDVEIEEPGF